jgi:hypothetical protein
MRAGSGVATKDCWLFVLILGAKETVMLGTAVDGTALSLEMRFGVRGKQPELGYDRAENAFESLQRFRRARRCNCLAPPPARRRLANQKRDRFSIVPIDGINTVFPGSSCEHQ